MQHINATHIKNIIIPEENIIKGWRDFGDWGKVFKGFEVSRGSDG